MGRRSFPRPGSLFAAAGIVLAIWGLILLAPAPGFCQDAPGGILGIIKAERSFARLPGVRIAAVNRDTGETWETLSDNFGFYGLPVEPGVYDISFHHPDFLTHIEGPLIVRENSAPSTDPVLWDLDEEGSSALNGHIFWPNEWPAAGYTVRLLTPAGELLEEVVTDDLGSFSFQLDGGGKDLVLEFINLDGFFDGNIRFQTTDRTARVLSTIASGYRNYYEDRGPWF